MVSRSSVLSVFTGLMLVTFAQAASASIPADVAKKIFDAISPDQFKQTQVLSCQVEIWDGGKDDDGNPTWVFQFSPSADQNNPIAQSGQITFTEAMLAEHMNRQRNGDYEYKDSREKSEIHVKLSDEFTVRLAKDGSATIVAASQKTSSLNPLIFTITSFLHLDAVCK